MIPATGTRFHPRRNPMVYRHIVPAIVVVTVLVLCSLGLGAPSPHSGRTAQPSPSVTSAARPTAQVPVRTVPPMDSQTASFARRVTETATALRSSGVAPWNVRLPNVGPPAQLVNGLAVPGAVVTNNSTLTPNYPRAPAPSGIMYLGENDTNGVIRGTTLRASSVVGRLDVTQLNAIDLDDDTPDMWGIQLNVVLTNVTLEGNSSNSFWVQNAADYFGHNQTLQFGEDTWNFSSFTGFIPGGNSTVLRHSPNGSVIEGVYIGQGPDVYAPMPFALDLYLNSTLSPDGEQECWFNYSLSANGGIQRSGNYDWIVFNSIGLAHRTVSRATFVASGTQLSPVGSLEDFEFDYGIGPYDGATVDVLSANASATLEYCPAANSTCESASYESVPAALDWGSTTGETSAGLSFTYNGTTEHASAGPFLLRGLWGYPASRGGAPGEVAVANAISTSGSPVVSSSLPYIFVFFNGSTSFDPTFEWAPDVPQWFLAPGTYQYEVMLADYAEQSGTLVVTNSSTSLSVVLPYQPSSGVYTPLWALDDGELAGISLSGTGAVTDQFKLFNNPTFQCTACGDAPNGDLSPIFYAYNDFVFPVFLGILLIGTTEYVDIDRPVSFDVFGFSYGEPGHLAAGPSFYLQIALVSTEFVTLSNDSELGGWPDMYEIGTVAGLVNASQNPFPQANVILWNSTHDAVLSNMFVPAWLVPLYQSRWIGIPPAITCGVGCVSPDGLLLYGGGHNTIWGNTFQDPAAPPTAPPQEYAGLAEAESGDLIYNNNFSIDNPTVYLPFDIYNESCPWGFAGDCPGAIPTDYADTWNVSNQSATNVSGSANGFLLHGNVLGPNCTTQGGNFWSTFGNNLNPNSTLPFRNQYAYAELEPLFPAGSSFFKFSIEAGGDYVPLTRSGCEGKVRPISVAASSPSGAYADIVVTGGGVVAVAVVGTEFYRLRRRFAGSAAPAATGKEHVAVEEEVSQVLARPTLRDRWARHPPNLSMWVGASLLLVYTAAAVTALVLFGGSLGTLPANLAWADPQTAPGPSWAHPFGVLSGVNTGLLRAEWQATPWDLGIVSGVLAIDVTIGLLAGAFAGANEGGWVDSIVTFVGDSIGAIPTFFFVIVLFAGFATVYPSSVGLPVFTVIFGLVLWPTLARTVRARARTVAHEPYVDASHALGATRRHILSRHILPNSLGPVLAQIPLDLAPIFFVLSAFPWANNCGGLGPPPPPPGAAPGSPWLVPALPAFSPLPSTQFPEWGWNLAIGTCEGLSYPGQVGYWWMYVIPLLVIVVFGLSVGLLCDGIDRWRRLHR